MTINTTTPHIYHWLSVAEQTISRRKKSKQPKQEFTQEWFMARLPNGPEAFTAALGTSFCGAGLGDINKLFGTNPVSKIVLRDATKAPPVVASAFFGFEVGATGYNYDTGYILSSTAKVLCKAGILYVFHKQDPRAQLGEIGSFGNFPCDGLARFFVIVGQKRKDANAMDTNYFYFMSSKFSLSWVSAAWHSSASKNLIMDSIGGEVGKRLALVKKFNTLGDKIVSDHSLQGFSKFMTVWSVNFGADLGNTLVLTWPGRVAQDGSGVLIDKLKHASMEKGLVSYLHYAWDGFVIGAVAKKLILALQKLHSLLALQRFLVRIPSSNLALGGAGVGVALALYSNAPKAYETYQKEMGTTKDVSRAVYDTVSVISGGLVSISSDIKQCINTYYTMPSGFIQKALLPFIKEAHYVGYAFYTNVNSMLERSAISSCYTLLERIAFWISGSTLSNKLYTTSDADGAIIPGNFTCLITALEDPITNKKRALTYVDAVLSIKDSNDPQKILTASVEHKSPELAHWALKLGAKCENLSPDYVARYCESFVNSWCQMDLTPRGLTSETNSSEL